MKLILIRSPQLLLNDFEFPSDQKTSSHISRKILVA